MSDTPTMEELEADLAEERATWDERTRIHKTALKAFEAAKATATTEELIELATAVKLAAGNVTNSESRIAKCNKAIEGFEFSQKASERNEAKETVEQGLYNDEALDLLPATGVTKMVITVEFNEDGSKEITSKLSGPGVGVQRVQRATGGSNGFKSAGAIKVDGVEYRSLNQAYMTLRSAKDGIPIGEMTPANSQSASNWLKKNEYAVESAA